MVMVVATLTGTSKHTLTKAFRHSKIRSSSYNILSSITYRHVYPAINCIPIKKMHKIEKQITSCESPAAEGGKSAIPNEAAILKCHEKGLFEQTFYAQNSFAYSQSWIFNSIMWQSRDPNLHHNLRKCDAKVAEKA